MALSVVIPALNAAARLRATLATVNGAEEIIVVDGGSTDDTPALAAASGATVIVGERGRGSQLAAGVEVASHDWLLLLHADTSLTEGWRRDADAHMAGRSDKAGYFRFALDSPDPRARRLERLVAWRCRWLALPYGDQGLLIHRRLLRQAGGIRPLPLMEDVDLIRRLGRLRLVALETAAVTSAAKWKREGWLRRSAHNLLCLGLWFAGVPAERLVSLYGGGTPASVKRERPGG